MLQPLSECGKRSTGLTFAARTALPRYPLASAAVSEGAVLAEQGYRVLSHVRGLIGPYQE